MDIGAYENQSPLLHIQNITTNTYYCAIQDCIDSAVDSQECVAPPSTYFEAIDFLGKAITLRSSDGAAVTTIDATGLPKMGGGVAVVRCVSGETAATVLDGFTITGGTGDTSVSGNQSGGGMFNRGSSPTVKNCTFTGNTALTRGGGMWNIESSNPTIINSTFTGNSCLNTGGGIYNSFSAPTLTNCMFNNNTADFGAGMFNHESSPTVTSCTFNDNIAETRGGGMYNFISSSPTLTNCIFSGNEAGFAGGGMYSKLLSNPRLTNCTFSGNKTFEDGAGMYIDGGTSMLANCTFIGNSAERGGGIYTYDCSATITGCTFIGNTADRNYGQDGGGGMKNEYGNPKVINCVFKLNSSTSNGGGMNNSGSNLIITNCMFSENVANRDGGGMSIVYSVAKISNCTFTKNISYSDGGGMFNEGLGLTCVNCSFKMNKAYGGGGGMYNIISNSTLTSCTFNGNTASIGGGMSNWGNAYRFSRATIINSTFYGNTATSLGGGLHNSTFSSPILSNCILWGDAPDEIFNDSVTSSIAFSNIENSGGSTSWDAMLGIDGGGNIDADPLFVNPLGPDGMAGTADDDLRLMPSSPCIDAGDYDTYLAAGGGLVDLDGKDRAIDNVGVMDTGVGSVTYLDMGAYEQGPCHDDGIINLNDLEILAGCLVGPDGGVNPSCGCSDYNMDGKVDLRDYASYQLEFTGPPTPTAQYQLTFESTWSAATHPQDFPSGPHFSGLIGGTHNRNVDFWKVGSLSSVGIKNMAELGSKTALTNEVNAAISADDAGSVISGGGIFPSPGSVSVNFTATQAFGLVTITSMLAPSPDWFVGLNSLVLFKHNRWADEIVVVVEPFDAGTDSGASYASANTDTNPAEAITQIVGFPFLNGAEQAPLGTFTITRID